MQCIKQAVGLRTMLRSPQKTINFLISLKGRDSQSLKHIALKFELNSINQKPQISIVPAFQIFSTPVAAIMNNQVQIVNKRTGRQSLTQSPNQQLKTTNKFSINQTSKQTLHTNQVPTINQTQKDNNINETDLQIDNQTLQTNYQLENEQAYNNINELELTRQNRQNIVKYKMTEQTRVGKQESEAEEIKSKVLTSINELASEDNQSQVPLEQLYTNQLPAIVQYTQIEYNNETDLQVDNQTLQFNNQLNKQAQKHPEAQNIQNDFESPEENYEESISISSEQKSKLSLNIQNEIESKICQQLTVFCEGLRYVRFSPFSTQISKLKRTSCVLREVLFERPKLHPVLGNGENLLAIGQRVLQKGVHSVCKQINVVNKRILDANAL
ncbi:C-terminal [Hexamita inflata]|uniref:C-terminal n=1 Tax=Hexamita inflata TaxID=28002 RepID=A0AA86U0C8_9EUKA|nr:C-terminal [Hexamita inflata]